MVTLGDSVLKEMERAATTFTKELTPLPSAGEADHAPPNGRESPAPRQSEGPTGDMMTADAAAAMENIADFSLFDNITGDDIFGHIDPDFDLNTVEDVLEGNLDIGLPPNWSDWSQFPT